MLITGSCSPRIRKKPQIAAAWSLLVERWFCQGYACCYQQCTTFETNSTLCFGTTGLLAATVEHPTWRELLRKSKSSELPPRVESRYDTANECRFDEVVRCFVDSNQQRTMIHSDNSFI
jgi:hypothetical protein